jgi:5'-methylthioadenosine phosphorylase
MTNNNVEIGIIGGTGIYDPSMIRGLKEMKIYTPFGPPSDLVYVGTYHDRKIAFVPRHGNNHQLPPHRIPYRANIWALKKLGVTRIISPGAVGSLREDYKPSEFVLVDQFIDRTKWRNDTFYEGGHVCHISTADPFCPELRELFMKSAINLKTVCHQRGTYVCIQGPRFSTIAESKLFQSWGADVIGMTLYPEVALAKEMGMCYVSIAMITDYDVWTDKRVSTAEIMKTMEKNVENFKQIVVNTIPKIPKNRHCSCRHSLKDAII